MISPLLPLCSVATGPADHPLEVPKGGRHHPDVTSSQGSITRRQGASVSEAQADGCKRYLHILDERGQF
jgi:hypothetical protein